MKKIIILISIYFITISSYSQTITYKDLIFILNSEDIDKIDDLLYKKGLTIGNVENGNGNCKNFKWTLPQNKWKEDKIHIIYKECKGSKKEVRYQSTNPINYNLIKNEISKIGYKKKFEFHDNGFFSYNYEKGEYNIYFGKTSDVNITDYFISLEVENK